MAVNFKHRKERSSLKRPNEAEFELLLKEFTNKKFVLHHKTVILLNNNILKRDLFDKEIFDLIITSPPYNVDIKYNSHKDNFSYDDYLRFSEEWMYNCFKWCKKQGRFCLNIPLDKNKGGQRSVGADLTTIAQKIGWKYHSTIVWNEGNISRRTAWGSWMSATALYVIAPVELIVILFKREWKKTDGLQVSDISKREFMEWTNGLWTFSGESKKRIGHHAPFPMELPYRCIKLFSFVNDIVFDPFVGSGTTLIAANNTNRYGVGVEIDAKYCELAKQRILTESETLFRRLMKKRKSVRDLIVEYFKKHPMKNMHHAPVVDWVEEKYKKFYKKKTRDTWRQIRKLHQEGFLIKVKKGIYKYDPDYITSKELDDFTPEMKRQILERDGYKCVQCGKSAKEGYELQIDHILPKDKGGKATLENGQTLCSICNFRKKNYNQTESGKRMFMKMWKVAKEI